MALSAKSWQIGFQTQFNRLMKTFCVCVWDFWVKEVRHSLWKCSKWQGTQHLYTCSDKKQSAIDIFLLLKRGLIGYTILISPKEQMNNYTFSQTFIVRYIIADKSYCFIYMPWRLKILQKTYEFGDVNRQREK